MSAIDPLGWVGAVVDGRVAIEKLVGEGGFGIVYRGKHLGFDEPVAVKCLKIPTELGEDEREKFLRDFRDEARILHRLSRKTAGIVQALDVGAAVSPRGVWSPFIIMEWLEGTTLDEQLIDRAQRGMGGRPLGEMVRLLEPAMRALAVTHASGIAHLDIKPANLFLAQQDGETTLKVLDFGIATALSTSKTLTRALTGRGPNMPAFTPNYAAPEQFNLRHGKPGAHTDVFALALVLIELVAGQPALEGDTPLQLYVASANEQLRPCLAAYGVQASEAVEAVLRQALAVDPARRPPDAGALWEALSSTTAALGAIGDVTEPAVRVSVLPDAVVSAPTLHARGDAQTALATAPRSTGRYRVCTVIHAELVGAAAVARRFGPEVQGELVDRAFDLVGGQIEQAGGEIVELVGDHVTAAFGLRSDTAAAAERAVHVALRLPRELAGMSQARGQLRGMQLGARTGVATGRVYVRMDRRATTSGLALTGRPIELAKRLARSATGAGAAIGRDTQRQVAGLFEVEPFELSAIEPDDPPDKAYRVKAAARGGATLGIVVETRFHGSPTRFVGRTAEMDSLLGVAGQAMRDGRSKLATTVGPVGIGLSRLAFELSGALERDQWVVLAAHGSVLQQRTSYAMAAMLLRVRFRIHEDDPRELVEAKLIRGIRELRGQAVDTGAPQSRVGGRLRLAVMSPEEIAEQLLRLLGYRLTASSGAGLTADEHSTPIKHRIAGAFAALLVSIRRPVAIVCDDVHWADAASLELLDELLVRCCDAPLFVACGGQPTLLDLRPEWGEGDGVRELVQVRPLGRARLEQIARDRLARVEALPDELVGELAERADGYPLALVETLHLLVDRGAIDTADPDSWKLDSGHAAQLSMLPTTVQGIVQARIDRLDVLTQELLLRAAAVGPVFWEGALASLVGFEQASVAASLADLCARGLVRRRCTSTFPEEQEYGFCESAVQLVAYEMLGQAARREIHRHVADWLEARAPTDATAALVARHYEKAAALDLAHHAYRRAAAHAASLGQNAEACGLYQRALRIDTWIAGDTDPDGPTQEIYLGWEPPDDARVLDWPERVGLRCELGEVERRMGDLAGAEHSFAAARACIVRQERRHEAAAAPDEVRRWDAHIDFRLSLVRDVQGRITEARELVERALAAARASSLCEEQAEMLAHLAAIHLRERDLQASLDGSLEGLRVCRGAARRGGRWRLAVAWLLRTVGGARYHAGRTVSAERCYLQAARLLDERRQPAAVARVLNNVAAARYARGEVAAARDVFRRTLELSDRSGDLWMTMTALGNLGEVEHHLGRHELGRDYLEQSVQLGEQIGARAELAECYRNLAIARAALGEQAGALEVAGRALELVAAGGADVYFEAVAVSTAELCAAAGGGPEQERAQPLAAALAAALQGRPATQVAARCQQLIAPLLTAAP